MFELFKICFYKLFSKNIITSSQSAMYFDDLVAGISENYPTKY